MSRTARRRKASSTMLRNLVWSGSSMDSMLTASERIEPGIHQRKPATLPSLRIVNVSLSFRTRAAKSAFVVIQVFPTIGNRTATTGPAATAREDAAAQLLGFQREVAAISSRLEKSKDRVLVTGGIKKAEPPRRPR